MNISQIVTNPTLEHALYLTEKMGWSIIPVGTDKKPLIEWKIYQTTKATREQVVEWFTKYPDTNVAVVMGKLSNVIVVDIDPRHNGSDKEFNRIVTVKSKTGGGGYHYFFLYEEGIQNHVGVKEGIDIRSEGGFVVIPPSIHESGNHYEWVMSPQAGTPILPLPSFIKDWISNTKPDSIGQSNWNSEKLKGVGEGMRNQTATSVAGKLLVRFPKDEWETEAWPLLLGWNTRNNPPLPEKELRTVFESIRSNELISQNIKVKNGINQTKETNYIVDKRLSISFQTLEQTIEKWLLLKDKGIVKVVTATVIANKFKADPVWLFLVTASGGAKTELIRGLNKIEGIYPISDLTPQTFLSGEKSSKNASLLLRLPSEVILTLKDFTTVLTMYRDKRHAILSQLREIYDGQYKKAFGTGETKEWSGKLGFIAGVTSIIDTHYSIYQTLGERFVQYRPLQANPIELSLKAINNSGSEEEMREEIQNAFADFIAGVNIPIEKIVIPDDLKNRIAYLSAFCVRARSGIVREGYSSREIELIPEAELPTRLAKQLITLASSLFLISCGFTAEDYELIYKIGMDTLPKNRRLVNNALVETDDYLETTDIAIKIGYPTSTTRRILEDLHGLRLIDRESKGKGYADRWIISESTKGLLEKAKPVKEGLPEESTG